LAFPYLLFTAEVIQPLIQDVRQKGEPGGAPGARDLAFSAGGPQPSNDAEIAMVGKFFELLAKWEDKESRGN
jgi:hypothetical protein